jgi:hypothetical protein
MPISGVLFLSVASLDRHVHGSIVAFDDIFDKREKAPLLGETPFQVR